nr:putative nucleotidyltransferase, ribonuclease H [Tanacetum cinerariifolium]
MNKFFCLRYFDAISVTFDPFSGRVLQLVRIMKAQKENGELWSMVENMKKRKQKEFRVDDHGLLWYGFPQAFKKNNAIWVLVDRLTKAAYFLPIQQGYSNAWGTRLEFSTAFHPQTDGQTKRSIQTLEDMLRSYALEWTRNRDDYLCLVEFTYNNSWLAIGERVIEGPELVKMTNEKVAIAKEKLKEARSRKKSYADRHQRTLEFKPGDRVFLKVFPCTGVRRFGLKGKLSLRFIGLFEILDRIGEVSYRLALPPHLSHVHNVFHVSLLSGYNYHPYHVVHYPCDKIIEDLSFAEEPKPILDRQERVMRKKIIPLVEVLWKIIPNVRLLGKMKN